MSETTRSRRQTLVAELKRIDGQAPRRTQPIEKHRKMAASPFRFLRGAVQLFYRDIQSGALPIPDPLLRPNHLTAVMGDCHLSNFGFLTEEGSHGDRVIFSPNDFDDACVGPAIWDLMRLSASVLLAAEYGRGLVEGRYTSDRVKDAESLRAPSFSQAMASVESFLTVYRKTCEGMIADSDRWMAVLDQFDKGHVLAGPLAKAIARAAGGKDFESRSALGKAVTIDGGAPRFRERPERFERLAPSHESTVRKAFRPYMDDEILDVVRRLGAGTGSVNMDRYYLLVGPTQFRDPRDLALCHVVEVKQQRRAAPIHYFPDISPVNTLNPAHLTIDCQRRMQRRPDLVLDEVRWKRAHWLVRSRHHTRVGIDPEEICVSRKKPHKRLQQYASACGEALALAHGRVDRRSTRFEDEMCRHIAQHKDAIMDACARYARQTEADWRTFRAMLGASPAG